MTIPMKSAALQQTLIELDRLQDGGMQPDITNHAERICTAFNSFILGTKQILFEMKKEQFDAQNLSQSDAESILEVLDEIEENAEENLARFLEFYEITNKHIESGCNITDFAKTCLKNAYDAHVDMPRHVAEEREKIMNGYWDTIPEGERLGNSPIFGSSNAPSISDYLDKLAH